MLICCLCLVTVALSWATWRRNQVFETQMTYWSDTLDKAPSPRTALNLGVQYM